MSSLHKLAVLAVVAVAAIALSSWTTTVGFAQSGPETLLPGPTYSARDIRQIEIHGLRLGLTDEDVARAMASRGFRLRNPTQTEGGGFYESPDGRFWLLPGYARQNRSRRLNHFTYWVREYTPAEASDVDARRAELLELFGTPTSWRRWINERGEIGDRFAYVSNRAQLEILDQAEACYGNWRCASVRDNLDCRPIVRRVRGLVVRGSFGSRFLYVSVDDYSRLYADLLKDRRFQRRDLNGVSCPILPAL